MSEEKKLIIPSHAVAVIYRSDNYKVKTLWQKKSDDYKWGDKWALFDGRIREEENPGVALMRELEEELGGRIILGNIKLLLDQHYMDLAEDNSGDERKGIVRVYSAAFFGKSSDITLGEGDGFAWFTKRDLDEERFRPFWYNRNSVNEFYARLENPKNL